VVVRDGQRVVRGRPRTLTGMTDVLPFYLAGRPATGSGVLDVTHPYDGSLVATVSVPTSAQVEEAVAAADAVRQTASRLSAGTRAEALMHVSRRLGERLDEVAALITAENGKPIKWARAEATRGGTSRGR
jgi:acyl-CoA reductase-like NAD-dependent aldehyde dehydrogenase